GEYLENARVTVEATSLEAFTDSAGQYRLTNVPAGAARVRVFFTGLDIRSAVVNVAPGAVVRGDFMLEATERPGAGRDNSVVKLSAIVIGVSEELDRSAIAMNQHRFDPNLRTVI